MTEPEIINWVATKEPAAFWCFSTRTLPGHVACAALLREVALQIESKPGRLLYGLTVSVHEDVIEMDVMVSEDPHYD